MTAVKISGSFQEYPVEMKFKRKSLRLRGGLRGVRQPLREAGMQYTVVVATFFFN